MDGWGEGKTEGKGRRRERESGEEEEEEDGNTQKVMNASCSLDKAVVGSLTHTAAQKSS